MNDKQIEKHKLAAQKLDLVMESAFSFIRQRLGDITEYDLSRFVIGQFKKHHLTLGKEYPSVIAAVNKNAALPHYFPEKETADLIEGNSLVLLDIWAKLDEPGAPFADITWVAYTGKDVPPGIKESFDDVVGARDFASDFIRKNLKMGVLPKTNEVNDVVRRFFGRMEPFFIHGAGHSLGIDQCHGKYFRFGVKSMSKMRREVPFTIEPGLYFPGKFGVRSEINCIVDKNLNLVFTSKVQKEITKI
jgi:Xaa-Pro dipeptidase